MKGSERLLDDLLTVFFICSLIALILIPILPWAKGEGITYEGDKAVILGTYQVMEASENKTLSAIGDSIQNTQYSFIGVLITGLIARAGFYLKKSKKYLMADYLLLSTIPLVFSSFLAMWYSVITILKIKGLGAGVSFGYNYAPIIFSVVLVICSSIFAYLVLPQVIKEIPNLRRMKGEEEMKEY